MGWGHLIVNRQTFFIHLLNHTHFHIDDGIEYKTNKDSRMKWDKWGNPYRIKKGDQVVSLSDLKSSTLCVDFNYSKVTKWSLEVLTLNTFEDFN